MQQGAEGDEGKFPGASCCFTTQFKVCFITDDSRELFYAEEITMFLTGRQSWLGELKARWASLSEIISFWINRIELIELFRGENLIFFFFLVFFLNA